MITRKEIKSLQVNERQGKIEKENTDRPLRSMVKRVFSAANKLSKREVDEVKENSGIMCSPGFADSRSKSSKVKTRVMVDMSNQKLPDVFRVKFG